jgi:hypothetical protein
MKTQQVGILLQTDPAFPDYFKALWIGTLPKLSAKQVEYLTIPAILQILACKNWLSEWSDSI